MKECSGSLPLFNCTGDISALRQRWKKYKGSVEYYYAAKAVPREKQKKSSSSMLRWS